MAFSVCTLGSGSGGNSTLVRAGRTALLVDAGFSARETLRRLTCIGAVPGEIRAVLLTHEHTDHVAGAASLSRRLRIPVLCRAAVREAARLEARGAVAIHDLPEAPFDLGDLRVTPFPVQHDAAETVGFVLEGEGLRVGYATDLGHSDAQVERRLSGCHVLLLEANHDVDLTRWGPYPWSLKERILGERGHLSNEAAGALLSRAVGPDTVQVVLAHLSETNNTPELALASAREGVRRSANPSVHVDVARQGIPGKAVCL